MSNDSNVLQSDELQEQLKAATKQSYVCDSIQSPGTTSALTPIAAPMTTTNIKTLAVAMTTASTTSILKYNENVNLDNSRYQIHV
jgi:hypothetical protein